MKDILRNYFVSATISLCFSLSANHAFASNSPQIDGYVWHPTSLTFSGPFAEESGGVANPFLDYRLQVYFVSPSGEQYIVPGYFDGDGKGAASGSTWRVNFTPDEQGAWSYRASFRTGGNVAVSLDDTAGKPTAFDGETGSFNVKRGDSGAPGFLKWGRLEYVGGHYLKFRNGPYWIRFGTDSPENFLAYAGFDNTPPSHRYSDHASDWNVGDPDWSDGKGKSIIGVLNDLASRRVNSIYFLTMNIGGDGRDVWPWAGNPKRGGDPGNDNLHFDLSKLRQWEIVFAHAQRCGINLHFVLSEAEAANKKELDNGELGIERKLYYRELIARFGHHNALSWNICEEYNLYHDLGPERIRAFAEYIRAVDPYDHPISVHSAGDPLEKLRFTFGDPRFSLTSIQLNQRRIDSLVEDFRAATAAAGRPLPISMDEFTVDAGQKESWKPVDHPELHRKQKLWPTLFSGGQIEFILGDLLRTDSFKTPNLQALWKSVGIARSFMEDHLPFWEMSPGDDLIQDAETIEVGLGSGSSFRLGAQVFYKPNQIYAIYFPAATRTGEIDLREANGEFQARWFNPRRGDFDQRAISLTAGDWVDLQAPPSEPDSDWVLLIKRGQKNPE